MLKQLRLLTGISVFWLALSILFDGINTLVLPVQLSTLGDQQTQATRLGLLTFIGLLAGMLIQPIAGILSDRWKPVLGRKGFIGIALLLTLVSLFFMALYQSFLMLLLAYLMVQVSVSVAQAGQQALIPDLVDKQHHGMASGMKGFMDLAGAMIGFALLGQLLGSGKIVLAIGAIAAALITMYGVAVLLTPEDASGHEGTSRKNLSLRQAFRLDKKQDAAFLCVVVSRFLFLFGIYAIGRFLLLFVAERLGLGTDQAAAQAGTVLAALALITALTSPIAGWLADRVGRVPLIIIGSILGALSAMLLPWAKSTALILVFGALMSIGSAAFSGGSWALLVDVIPGNQSARYFGLAHWGTAGAAAFAGLLGPLMDWSDRILPGSRFPVLFTVAAVAFLSSVLPLAHNSMKEVKYVGKRGKRKTSTDAPGLAVVSLPADPAASQEDTHSP
ncbi:MAG: MFS transporter [Anaerolineales bacterium]